MDLHALLGGPYLYVQLSPDRLKLRDVRSGRSFDQPAVLAIARSGPRRIVALGDQALACGAAEPVELVWPFAHPRSLVGDCVVGEQLLKAAIQTLLRGRWLAMAPRLLLHPLGDPAGGLTQVEQRALHELGRGAGAARVTLWQGPPLTDEQVLSGRYPPSGKVLAA